VIDDDDDDVPKRDAQGRWMKGTSGSPGGLTRRQAMLARMLEGLSPKAIQVYQETLECDDPKLRFEAAKDIVRRVAPPPPRTPSVAVNVEVNNAAAKQRAEYEDLISKCVRRLAEDRLRKQLASENARDAEYVAIEGPKGQTEGGQQNG
jgi:hypothetical protein